MHKFSWLPSCFLHYARGNCPHAIYAAVQVVKCMRALGVPA